MQAPRVRILGVGDHNDLGALYLALLAEGHDCRVHIRDAADQDTLAGLVPRSEDWRADLAWIRAAGKDGVILLLSGGGFASTRNYVGGLADGS